MTGKACAHLIEKPDHFRRKSGMLHKFLVGFNERRNLRNPLVQSAAVACENLWIQCRAVAIQGG